MESISSDKKAQEILTNLIQNGSDLEKRAYGCIMGAFIGDALGALTEFQQSLTQSEVVHVMNLPGGGTRDLLPAQATDDTELALSLAYALIEGSPNYDLSLICKYYGIWLNSNPFDCGITISESLGPMKRVKPQKDWTAQQMYDISAATQVIKAAKKFSMSSQSNGCLMRITPLVIYCLNLNKVEEIEAVVQNENSLTHPNVVCQCASVCWVLALTSIIKNKGDAQKGYEAAKNYVFEKGHDDIKKWWNEGVEENKFQYDQTRQGGWVRISWTIGFQILKNWDQKKFTYQDVMHNIIACGGDTDTNACILGGLMGALLTFEGIPKEYINKMLQCNVSKSQNKRDEMYSPYYSFIVCEKLLKLAPNNVKLVIDKIQ